MEIFSNTLEINELKTILREQLGVNTSEVVVFPQTPSMTWVEFFVNNIPLRIIYHQQVERYGFKGSLTKVEINSKIRSYQESDQETLELVSNSIVQSVGGIIIHYGADDCLEGFDRPGASDSTFILKQLHLHGVEDEEISNVLESLLNKNKIKLPTN